MVLRLLLLVLLMLMWMKNMPFLLIANLLLPLLRRNMLAPQLPRLWHLIHTDIAWTRHAGRGREVMLQWRRRVLLTFAACLLRYSRRGTSW
jgi:hypothetical protein